MTGVYGAELSFAEAGDAKKRKWSAYGMTSLNRVLKAWGLFIWGFDLR